MRLPDKAPRQKVMREAKMVRRPTHQKVGEADPADKPGPHDGIVLKPFCSGPLFAKPAGGVRDEQLRRRSCTQQLVSDAACAASDVAGAQPADGGELALCGRRRAGSFDPVSGRTPGVHGAGAALEQ